MPPVTSLVEGIAEDFLAKHQVAVNDALQSFPDVVKAISTAYPKRIAAFKKNPTKALRKILATNPKFFSDLHEQHKEAIDAWCNKTSEN
jgi:GTP1/Obg family GTP-binding protein